MRVLFDKVAVIPTPAAEKRGLLYVAPSSDEGQVGLGRVASIGSDVKGVTVNDKVYFNRFTSFKVTVDSIDYYILKEVEIIAVS